MIINGYDAWELTKSFLTMSNDCFFKLYDFNWVPPQWMQDTLQKENNMKLQKEFEKNLLRVGI